MAGKIVADTLEHSTAGSVTTDYVVNGSCKAWVNLNGETFGSRDSHNISSNTDNGTGDYSSSFTSSFANDDFAFAGLSAYFGSRVMHHGSEQTLSTPFATGTVRMTNSYTTATNGEGDKADVQHYHAMLMGDLA